MSRIRKTTKLRPRRRFASQDVVLFRRALQPYEKLGSAIAWGPDMTRSLGLSGTLNLCAQYGDQYVYWTHEKRAFRFICHPSKQARLANRPKRKRAWKAAVSGVPLSEVVR